jgi:cytoskeleton protein RodZ
MNTASTPTNPPEATGAFVLTNPEAMPESPQSVGQMLRHARVLAGLTPSDVASRLRMSVKQIEALEEANYASLPSGTFLRGFVRNYAKAVAVDADTALNVLEQTHTAGKAVRATPVVEPVAAVAPVAHRARALSLPQRAVPIHLAEASSLANPRTRIAFAALLVVCLLAVVWYWWNYMRPHLASGGRPPVTAPVMIPVPAPAVGAASAPVSDAAAPTADSPSSTAGGTAAATTGVGNVPAPDGASTASIGASTGTGTPPQSTPLPTTAQATSGPRVTPPPAALAVSPTAAAGAPSSEAAKRKSSGELGVLGFTFTAESWVEVTDGTGRTVISRRYKAGEADEVSGRGPFTIVVGNAQATRMAYNGREFDLAPHTRVSVARVTLK